MTPAVQNDMRNMAAALLKEKKVAVFIGFAEAGVPGKAVPAFITTPEDCERLIWNDACQNNLAVYLTRKEVKKLGKVAIAAKTCDIRSIAVLIQENQIKREEVHILAMPCSPAGGPSCDGCAETAPAFYDALLGAPEKKSPDKSDADLTKLEAMSVRERWDFWEKEFSRCIKCYACRAACPMCYCTRCIVEKSQPQWISPSLKPQGNFSWNLIRAMHLAGRCVQCGACERACPMGIPIGLLNRKLAKTVKEQFNVVPGTDPTAPIFQATYKLEDPNDFIR